MPRRKRITVREALEIAAPAYGSEMAYKADRGGQLLEGGLDRFTDTLDESDGVKLLGNLANASLKPRTKRVYYIAIRRALALNGVVVVSKWPPAPKLPRVRSRQPIEEAAYSKLVDMLRWHGHHATADLALLLVNAGLRVKVEALSDVSLTLVESKEASSSPTADEADEIQAYAFLRIIGKGGHERLVPVIDADTLAILRDPERLRAVRSLRYKAHLRYWRKAVEACGIVSKLPTPHAARHSYAVQVYRHLGNDLRATQELLGHADPGTTATYLEVDMNSVAKRLIGHA